MKKLIFSTALLTIIPLMLAGCTIDNNLGHSKPTATSKQSNVSSSSASSTSSSNSVRASSIWNKSKDNQLANFMVSFGNAMKQSYTQCTPQRNTTYAGMHYPDDFSQNKTAFNDKQLSAGWTSNGSDKYDVNVVAIYEDTNGGSTIGGRIYLFTIQDGAPIVYYTEQNQGMPDGLTHFEETKNVDLSDAFKEIVDNQHSNTSSSSNQSKADNNASNSLTFNEGMEILRQSIYKDYLQESPQLVSNDKQKLVISSLSGAKGINYFTLTLEDNNQVKIHAEMGSIQGGPRNQFNATDNIPEYQTVKRLNS